MRTRRRALLALLALPAVVVAGLLYLQVTEDAASAGRRVGIAVQRDSSGLTVFEVGGGSAAEAGGLAPGDRLLEVDGVSIGTVGDYDRVAVGFRRGEPVTYRVLRGERTLDLTVRPGAPFPWRRVLINLIATLGHLALGLLALAQRPEDLRARLLGILTLAVAVEYALPLDTVGSPLVAAAAVALVDLLSGLQFATELHLASLIPERRSWLARRPWAVPLFYVVGLGVGVTSCVTYILEEVGLQVLPWSSLGVEQMQSAVFYPLWAVAVVALLAEPALTHREPVGRQQAVLVLLGVLPWAVMVMAVSGLDAFGAGAPLWLVDLQTLAVLIYPVAVFSAIFRYQLFDLELVVRRSLVYGALTGLLILVFYGAVGAGGALFSQLLGGGGSVWVVGGATLLLGLVFNPLKRLVQRGIERRFFPEREALRRRLVALAGELPAHGKLPSMGRHLVAELCDIFAIRSATLLLTHPNSGLLYSLASTATEGGETGERAFLLPADDPFIEELRRSRRPIATRRRHEPTALVRRLAQFEVALAAPLMRREELVGVLLLGPKEGGQSYTSEEVELLDLLSHHVTTVLENARLFESATLDSLTGLLRRETIFEELVREVERARRYDRPLAIGMADLDNFKVVNDRHGHQAGDLLLSRVASELAGAIRSTDAIGRYGGEEFLLVLPETDLTGAAAVAEKVRSALEAAEVRIEGGETLPITVSIGLAARSGRGGGSAAIIARELVAAADRALYRAKGEGRNRVALAGDGEALARSSS